MDLRYDEVRYQQDFNIFLSLSEKVKPLKHKNNLGIILDSKPKEIMNVVTKRKVKYSYEKVCIVNFRHSQHFVIFSVQEKSSSYLETMKQS